MNQPETLKRSLCGWRTNTAVLETTEGAEQHFTGGYRRGLFRGVGHFPQREEPDATAEAILEHISRYE